MARRSCAFVAACVCSVFISLPLPSALQTANTDPNDNTNAKPATTPKPKTPAVSTPQHINIKVLIDEPFVMRNAKGDFEGLFVDIVKYITEKSNLTYSMSIQDDNAYGFEYSPGVWSGLVGSVQNGTADLAVAPISIVSARQKVIDFTQPVMSAGLRILYKIPDPSSSSESFGILLSPFTPGLWVVLLLMFIGVSCLFYVIGRFSPYEDQSFVGKAATYEGLTLTNSFLYTFTAMTFQGYTAAPQSISGRFLAAFWWMFVLLVIAAYSASLCAIFLAYKPSINSVPFATFDELSKQSDVAYGIVKGGSTSWYLSNSERPLQKRLWETISANADNVLVNSVRDGVFRMQKSNGDFAMIVEGPIAEHLSSQPPCSLMTLGEELNEHAYGFACQKNSSLTSLLNTAILQMNEEDYIFELKKKWLHQGCNRDDTSEYFFQGLAFFDTFGSKPNFLAERSVTLRRFGTGFLVLFIGVFLSGALLLGEMFYAKRRGTAVPQRMPRSGMDDQVRIDREYRDEDA